MSTMKLSRRSFIKVCGLTAAYTVFAGNMARQAFAASMEFVGLRQKQVYHADAKLYKYRKSQDNPMIKKLYDKHHGFLHEGPCGHMSHRLLHTDYTDRSAQIKALKDKGITLNI